MVKTCVVKSCTTRREKRISGSSLSLFQVKNKAQLEKWKMSLGIKLKSTDFICHLHFKEDDIKMYEKIYIDDELKIIPLAKKMLKEEAVPTIEHQFIPISWYPGMVHELAPSKVHEQQIADSDHQSMNEDQDQVQPKLTEEQELLEDKGYLIIPIDDNEQSLKDLEEPLLTQHTYNLKTHHRTEIAQQSLQRFVDNIGKFSTLPKFWLYVENPKGPEFMRIDSKTKMIKHHIRLNRDSSISLILPNDEEMLLKDKINSFNNIYDYLKLVERWPLCVGTQMNDMYSRSCKGVLKGDDTYKRQQQFPRCKACRKLRASLRKYYSTSTSVTERRASHEVTECEGVTEMYNVICTESGHDVAIQVEDIKHGLPNPARFPKMYEIWSRIITDRVNITLSKTSYSRVRLCRKHFENRFKNRHNRLSSVAVPTLHLPKRLDDTVYFDHPYSKESLDEGAESQNNEQSLNIEPLKLEFESLEVSSAKSDDYDCDSYDDDSQPPISASSKDENENESGPLFSWEKSVDLITDDMDEVECSTIGDDVGVAQTPTDISLYDDDLSTELVCTEKHAEYYCNECRKEITGCRYTCVQCADWDLCGACEARAAHAAHYVLRVPGQRAHNEIQTVLATIRKQLLCENLFTDSEITTNLKDEPKEELKGESEPEIDETEPSPDPLEEFARNMELQARCSKSERTKVVDTDAPRSKRLKILQGDENLLIGRNRLFTVLKHDDTRPKSMKIGQNLTTISGNTSKKTLHVPSKLKIVGKGSVPTRLKPIAPDKVPRELIALDKVLRTFKRKPSNSNLLLRLPPGSDPTDVARALITKVDVRLKPLKKEEIEKYQKKN